MPSTYTKNMAQNLGRGVNIAGARDNFGRFLKGHINLKLKRLPDSFCLSCKKVNNKPRHKYCSRKCYSQSRIGEKHWWGEKISRALTGKPKTKEHIKNVADALRGRKRPDITGKNCPWWKGDWVGYDALHDWVKRKLGHPKSCKNCGKEGKKVNGKWNIHWANKSGKYRRNLSDWINLCVKCHSLYDHGKLKI